MKSGLSKEVAGYYPPEIMPFALYAGVLESVLTQNIEAKKLYDQIKDYCSLPGCQETFDKLENRIPNGETLVKAIVKKAGYDFKKPPNEDNQMVLARGLLGGVKKLASDYAKRFRLWIRFGGKRNRDFRRLCTCMNEFIKVGFNNDSEQEKGKYKVTAFSSNMLVLTVFFRAFAEVYKLNIDELGKAKMFRNGKKLYSINAVNDGELPSLH